jgi:hypothetical protein
MTTGSATPTPPTPPGTRAVRVKVEFVADLPGDLDLALDGALDRVARAVAPGLVGVRPGGRVVVDVDVASFTGSDLCRALRDGELVPPAYQAELGRVADVLSRVRSLGEVSLPGPDRLDAPRPASDQERSAIVGCGDWAAGKLARLLEEVAQIRGRGVELSGLVDLLDCDRPAPSVDPEICVGLLAWANQLWKPYVVVGADGVRRSAAEGDPQIAGLPSRSLAFDDVHGILWRDGREVSMGSSTLLQRLMLLFAGQPLAWFSQEDVVRAVWGVDDYHKIRHSPMLFNGVARIRRLLGPDGSEILQMVRQGLRQGYRLVPPADFLCVTRALPISGGSRESGGTRR